MLRLIASLIALALVAGVFLVLPRDTAQLGLLGLLALGAVAGAWRAKRYGLPVLVLSSTQRLRLRQACILAGAACLLLAWAMLLPQQSLSTARSGLTVFVVATMLLGALFYRDATLFVAAQTAVTGDRPIRWRWVVGGVIALLAVIQAHFLLNAGEPIAVSPHIQMVALIVGWGFMVAGLWGGWPRFTVQRPSRTALALGAILLLALAVRIFLLAGGVHRWIDEVNFLFAINALKSEQAQPVLMPFGGITAFSWLFPYAQWVWQALSGPSVEAVRMPSVLFGVAQVAAVYFLMIQIASRRAALIAALLLATFPAAVHFSRIGINNIADPLFGVLALAFLARAFRAGRRSDYVLAGAMLGLSHYFYEGGRLFYTLFVVCWCGWMFLMARRPRRSGRHWIMGVVAFVLIAAPLYAVWAFNSKPFFPRLDQTGVYLARWGEDVEKPSALNRFQVFALSYVTLGEGGPFYRNDSGFVLPPLIPLFLVGLAACVWRLRTPGGALLFWWCLGVVVATLLISRTIDAPRFVVVFPALCAVMGVGADLLAGRLQRIVPRRYWRESLVGLLMVLLALGQAHWYLAYHMPLYYERQFARENDFTTGQPSKDMDDVIFRAVQLRSPVEVYIYAKGFHTIYGFGATAYYFDRTAGSDFYLRWDYTDKLISTIANWRDMTLPKAFFLEPNDEDALAALQDKLTLHGPYYSPWGLARDRQMALWVTDTTVLPTAWTVDAVPASFPKIGERQKVSHYERDSG